MSQFALLLSPFSCLSFLVWLMRWTHTTSHRSWILRWRSFGWLNVVCYGYGLLFLWGRQLLIVENCFAMGFRGTTTTSLPESGDFQKYSLGIASVIFSQQTQGHRRRTCLTLMKLITKSLSLPVVASTIPVLLLAIQRSAQHRISW